MPYVTTSELSWRLQRRKATGRHHGCVPIGLHLYSKSGTGPCWYGVGPVLAANRAVSWFDIRIPSDPDYERINRMLAAACRQSELAYVNVASLGGTTGPAGPQPAKCTRDERGPEPNEIYPCLVE